MPRLEGQGVAPPNGKEKYPNARLFGGRPPYLANGKTQMSMAGM